MNAAERQRLIARPIAHRGLHAAERGVVENTRSAFLAALESGYGVETDVQISADGEAMVHHDDALGRLTDGSARLSEMDAAALRRVRFKATDDRMMSLSELLDLVDGRTLLLIELKSHPDTDLRLPGRVAQCLAAYSGPVGVMSFDIRMIAALGKFAPRIPRGLVAERRWSEPCPAPTWSKLLAAQPQFVAYSVKDLPAAAPLFARYFCRMPLLTWTVRTAEDRRRAARFSDQMIFEGFRP